MSTYVSDGFSERPLYLGCVYGIRSWGVESGLLVSPYRPHVWRPDVKVHLAQCQPYFVGFGDEQQCSGLATRECDCGFFACTNLQSFQVYRSDYPDPFFPELDEPQRPCGIVKGYGLVVRGTKGWRASKVEIVAIQSGFGLDPGYDQWLVDEDIDDLARTYGVADTAPPTLR